MKAALKTLLPDNRFARSVAVLASGTVAGQLIVIAASPILTRLYTPEDFGLLAVYAGILGILGVIASLRYQLAIPLPDSDKDAANIAVLSLVMVVVTTLCSAVIVWLFGDQLVVLLNTPNLAPYLWLVPIGSLLVGIYQVFQYWAIRRKNFSDIARTRFTQSLGMTITQIAGYTLGPDALLLGRIVGQSLGVVGLAKSAFTQNGCDFGATTVEKVQEVSRQYKNFPLVGTWTGLASSAGLNLTPLLIASFLGVGPAGLFSLSHRVLSQPMAVIGKAVNDTFYQKAAEANRSGQIGQSVEAVYSILVRLALAPAITIYIVIPDIFIFVFGNNWAMAGEIARWMTPWLFFQFVVSPCTGIYPIIDRHDIALRFQLSLLASSVFGSVVGGFYYKNIVLVVALISVLSSLVYLWRAIATFKIVKLNCLDAIYSIAKAIPVSILINTPVILIISFMGNSLVTLILGALTNSILWFILLVRPLVRTAGGIMHGD